MTGPASPSDAWLQAAVLKVYRQLRGKVRTNFARTLPFGDYFTDRWERAAFEGFGEGSSCYDNVLVMGQVKVGRHTWIGPNCVLDGSGDLEIGDFCSISAGVQIYTHQTVEWATSLGKAEVPRAPVKIGSGVYIGPNTVIQMGVEIGDKAVVGAMSFVNKSVPAGVRVYGTPARPA